MIVEIDGLNGFIAVEREKPDLVILDIMLPVLMGSMFVVRSKAIPI